MEKVRLLVFLLLVFLIVVVKESESKSYQMIDVGNGKKIKIEFFTIVNNINRLQCRPTLIRAKIVKIDKLKKITFLKVVSKTHKGLLFALNFVAKEKKGKHLVGMICKHKKQFAFFVRRVQ